MFNLTFKCVCMRECFWNKGGKKWESHHTAFQKLGPVRVLTGPQAEVHGLMEPCLRYKQLIHCTVLGTL